MYIECEGCGKSIYIPDNYYIASKTWQTYECPYCGYENLLSFRTYKEYAEQFKHKRDRYGNIIESKPEETLKEIKEDDKR